MLEDNKYTENQTLVFNIIYFFFFLFSNKKSWRARSFIGLWKPRNAIGSYTTERATRGREGWEFRNSRESWEKHYKVSIPSRTQHMLHCMSLKSTSVYIVGTLSRWRSCSMCNSVTHTHTRKRERERPHRRGIWHPTTDYKYTVL